jgi:hypothetical protein
MLRRKSTSTHEKQNGATVPFLSVGQFRMGAGQTSTVTFTKGNSDGYLVIDAVRWLAQQQ